MQFTLKEHDGLNPEEITIWMKERKPCIHTHTQKTPHHRNTHHPHVSALSSCIQACRGRPQACDCVRGDVWMANSIWTEDPILRCQYSPHYLCSLVIQEQNVNFEKIFENRRPSGGDKLWHNKTTSLTIRDNHFDKTAIDICFSSFNSMEKCEIQPLHLCACQAYCTTLTRTWGKWLICGWIGKRKKKISVGIKCGFFISTPAIMSCKRTNESYDVK